MKTETIPEGFASGKDWLGEALAKEATLLLIHPADTGNKTTTDGKINPKLSSSWQALWRSLKLKMMHFNLCKAGYLPTYSNDFKPRIGVIKKKRHLPVASTA